MKKTGNYLKCGIALLIGLVLISSFVSAQYELVIKEARDDESALEEKSGLTPIQPPSSEGVVIYTPPYIPAPKEVIDKLNNYIISIMGKDYFAEHFELVDARKRGERYVPQNQTIEPMYMLTYNYTHNLKDEPYRIEYTFRQGVYLNGNFINKAYTGPREPYNFSLSKNEVRNIAAQNGMEEPFGVELYGYKWIARRPEEICTEKGKIETLFIHVDTGKILDKKISEGCVGVEVALTNIEKTDIEPTQEIQINNSISEDTTDKKDLNKSLNTSKNEEGNIIQKMISWIKSLFQ